jgi:hypothetical protein
MMRWFRSLHWWLTRNSRVEREYMSEDLVINRLDDQIAWYEDRSGKNQRRYKSLKITVLVLAALIPFLSGLQPPSMVPAGVMSSVVGLFGVTIAIIEGVQQVCQYHANWITYRSTCEALKHEKFLYLGNAGPYAEAADPRVLLAERIESVVSQEHARWASSQEIKDKQAGAKA